MAGLDPAIQGPAPEMFSTRADARLLDGRLKGGHDEMIQENFMSDDGTHAVRVEADVGGLTEAAALVERAFDRSMDAVANTIGRAARSGQTSFHGMVDAIVGDLSRIAVQSFIVQPLEGLLKGVFNFGGARATGGPVAPGQSYLVGENGPELFTPAGHGAIAANGAMGGGRGVVINVTTPDAASFARSEAQLGAMLSRAVARGQRRL